MPRPAVPTIRSRSRFSDEENNDPIHLQPFRDSSVSSVSNWDWPHCTQAISGPPCTRRGSPFHGSLTRLSFIYVNFCNSVGMRSLLRPRSCKLALSGRGSDEEGSISRNGGQTGKTSRDFGCSQSATNTTIGRTPCILGAILSRTSLGVYRLLVVNAATVEAKRTHTAPHS